MDISIILFSLLVFVSTCNSFMLDCPSLPPHVPANISDLRPSNIKVIMALGDSITAGFGIQGTKGQLNESRGLSATIGGDANAITLANFIKFYSPNVQGSSLGMHIVEFCGGETCPPGEYHASQDVLNAAQSGAMVMNLYPHEINYLISQLKSNPNINMQEDWKLLTIFIGANDLCGSCANQSFLHPDDYETRMLETLENIRTTIPRVFVQLVEIFNLSQTAYCSTVRRVLSIECGCLFEHASNATRQLIDEYSQGYNMKSAALAAHYQGLNYPGFTVVSQPFGRNTALRDLPISMLSTLDCFHPSLYAHQAMAIGLWNNLLTPAAQKKTYLNMSDTPICPTADTLLYTY